MRNSPLLTAPPPAAVTELAEIYAIALIQAETAASRYDGLATALTNANDCSKEAVSGVFSRLSERERERIEDIRLRCLQSTHKPPTPDDLNWQPTDLVPSDELSDLADSALATPFQAWAVAVRHRQRGFVFWTYVAAQTTRPTIQSACEAMAREALADADVLRRERRAAWRTERHAEEFGDRPFGEMSSAALLESLLFKEVVRWARALAPVERDQLSAAAGYSATELAAADPDLPAAPATDTLDDVRQRTIRYAEQVTMIYLDEADHATDHLQLELAQALTSSSIARLASLRLMAQRH